MVIVRKIVIPLVACSFLFVGTSIYAKSNSTMTLLEWYQKQFQILSGQLDEEVQFGLISIEESTENEKEQLLREFDKKLGNFILSTSATANADIEKYKDDYLRRVAETKELLMETELLEIEQEMERTEKEIENSAFMILSELLSENVNNGTTEH